MAGYIIAIVFTMLCWTATYILSFLAINKNLYDACFETWYVAKKYDRLPKDKIKSIISIEQNNIMTFVLICWILSSLFTGITITLIYFM